MSDSDDEQWTYDELGGLKVQEVRCGPADCAVVVRVEALQQLDPLDALDLLEGFDYTGQLVWLGALILVEHLCSRGSAGVFDVASKAVLELGAGTGLAGLAAAQLGAAHVLLTDGNERSVRVLDRNIALCPDDVRARVSSQLLRWSADIASAACVPGSFDCVLAADVAYSAKFVGALFDAVAAALAPAGVFLFAHCPRGGSLQPSIDAAIEREGARVGLVRAELELTAIGERMLPSLSKEDAGIFARSHLFQFTRAHS